MSSLRDLVYGDGRLDTALRSFSLAVFAAVAIALIWTAVSIRADAAALSLEPPTREPSYLSETDRRTALNESKENNQ